MNLLLLMSVLTIFLVDQQGNATQAGTYDARIETNLSDGKLQISNVFENNSPETVNFTYKFKCRREGRSGTSTSSQSGTFKAAPGETVTLSQTAVSFMPSDDLQLSLDVYRNGKPVASDSYSSGQE